MLKFGKLPARPNAVTLKFSEVFEATALPTPPVSFGHENLVTDWGMFGNDQYGDCVFAGAAHEQMLWSREGAGDVGFTLTNVLSDYTAVTGFNPNDPATDQGTDMQAAAAYRQKTGVIDAVGTRHKIDAYAALTAGNVNELALAAWLFGAVGVGINCPSDLEDQFTAGQPWSVTPNTSIVGGHYVPCIGKDTNGNFLFVTWGKVQPATPDWVSKYMTEGICYLDLEFIGSSSKVSPENFNAEALEGYLKEIT